MATRLLLRPTLSRHLVPLTLGLSGTAMLMSRQAPIRLEALPIATREQHSQVIGADRIDAAVIKQVSGGSISGLVTGLLVSVFSKTLVLLAGISLVVIQVASRYGIDLVGSLRLREKAKTSKVIEALLEDTPFKLAFGITFALSAFASF